MCRGPRHDYSTFIARWLSDPIFTAARARPKRSLQGLTCSYSGPLVSGATVQPCVVVWPGLALHRKVSPAALESPTLT